MKVEDKFWNTKRLRAIKTKYFANHSLSTFCWHTQVYLNHSHLLSCATTTFLTLSQLSLGGCHSDFEFNTNLSHLLIATPSAIRLDNQSLNLYTAVLLVFEHEWFRVLFLITPVLLSTPLYAFLAVSPTNTSCWFAGHSWHPISYTTLDFLHDRPVPSPPLHTRQSLPWHPLLAVGFDLCTALCTVLPPPSTTLNFRPGSASASVTSLMCNS